MKAFLIVFLFLLAVAGCSKSRTTKVPHSVFPTHPDFPEASNARPIPEKDWHAIELQLTDNGWRVHGKEATQDRMLLRDQIKKCKEKINADGYQPTILIEAEKNTKVSVISKIISTSASAGVDHFFFATTRDSTSKKNLNDAIGIHFPVCSCGGGPIFNPFNIFLKGNGSIQTERGMLKVKIDQDITLRELPELENRLAFLTTGTRASGKKNAIALHLSPDSSYQRMIDLFNLIIKLRIKTILLSVSESYEQESTDGYLCLFTLPEE